MNKIIVTGCSGYIATNLIPKLIDSSIKVIGYDIDAVPSNTFESYRHDVASSDIFLENIDAVVHLAAISGIKDCNKNINKTMYSNILSTIRVFKYAYSYNIPVVFASSQATKIGGNLYAMTKSICENVANVYNENGANINVLRLCNVYGGKDYIQKKSTAVANFIKCKINNKVAVIHGNGQQKRDFIHVDDVCDAIIKALTLKNHKRPIDIGTGLQTSVLHLAKNVIQCKYIFDENLNSGVSGNGIDVGIAQKHLGFTAKKKIDNIMEEYYNV